MTSCKERAKKIEAKLPQWGKLLFDAIVAKQEKPMRAFIDAKPASGERLEKRITVNVEYRNADAEGASAAALLFGLPWELLHDEYSYLFDGAAAIRVRRTLPSENEQPPIEPRDRVRVLLVRARPEDSGAKFIDPRSSALPLAEVLHDLGESVQLDVPHDGTFKALSDALTKADDNNEPYQIVHFDGHGIYEKSEGIGKLCFEDAEDAHNGLEKRQSHKVSAKELGGLLRARRVPLGELPDAPRHGFVGRARELLSIERRIVRRRRVAIVGAGGEGKTVLAIRNNHHSG